MNLFRRHLTKQEKASLIVRALEAAKEFRPSVVEPAPENDRPNLSRSFSPTSGKKGGSTKDPVKRAAVEEAAKHGISEGTVKRALADERKPADAPPPKKSQRIVAAARRGPCTRCGQTFPPAAMQFHHRNGAGQRPGHASTPARAFAELVECDLLCAVCHALRHCADTTEAATGLHNRGEIRMSTYEATVTLSHEAAAVTAPALAESLKESMGVLAEHVEDALGGNAVALADARYWSGYVHHLTSLLEEMGFATDRLPDLVEPLSAGQSSER